MKDISLLEEIDANLSRIIEGLPEGKLKEIAEETKRDFDLLQSYIFELDDLRHKIWRLIDIVRNAEEKTRKLMKKMF